MNPLPGTERRTGLIGEGDPQLQPEWMQKTSALVEGGLDGPGWRAGAPAGAAAPKIPSRFDTSGGPMRWKDEGNPSQPRRDPMTRWNAESGAAERWVEGGVGSGARPYADTYPTERWTGPIDAGAGRGRGRGGFQESPPGSWKPREAGAEWRGGGGGGLAAVGLGAVGVPAGDPVTRNDWRNDRWGHAPGSRTNDSWRGAGGGPGGPGSGGGGFAAGMGRGAFSRQDSYGEPARVPGPGLSGGAAAAAAGSGRAPSSSFFRSFGSGGGVGGSLAWGPSKAQLRYSTDELARVYRQLLYSGRLRLPRSVERDDPLLFLAEGDFVDVVEQFSGVDPRAATEVYELAAHLQRMHARGLGGGQHEAGGVEQQQYAPQQDHPQQGAFASHVSPPAAPPAPQQDPGWVYRDPQGVLQGPFPPQDIIEWYEAGFFPLDLQLRSTMDPPTAPFHVLQDLLQAWRAPQGPPGFGAQHAPPPQPLHPKPAVLGHPQQQQQQHAMPTAGFPLPAALPDDLLSTGMEHLGIQSHQHLGMPQEQQHMGVGGGIGGGGFDHNSQQQQYADPVVDPAMIKRSPSSSLLMQPQQPELHSALVQPGALGVGLMAAPRELQQQQQPAWAVHPQEPPAGLSLAAIQQQEEEKRARAERDREEAARRHQELLMAGAPPAPPPPPPPPAPYMPLNAPASAFEEAPAPEMPAMPSRPETKPAPWVAAAPVAEAPAPRKKSLLDIQAEEAELRAKEEAAVAAAASVQRSGPVPSGGWARVARGPTVSGPASGAGMSLLEIQRQEELLKAAARDQQQQQPEGDGDDTLFWDYERPVAPPTAAALAPALMQQAPVPRAKTAWAAAASKGVTMAPAPVAAPVPVARPNGAAAPRAAPAAVAAASAPVPAAAASLAAFAFEEDLPSGGDGSSSLTGSFRMWCVEQMQALSGSRDVTLCEFLMTVESNSEVAEYVATYLGATPAAAKFSSEFLKRKLAELAVAAASGKKSRKARAKANAAAAAASGGAAKGKAGGGGGADAGPGWAQTVAGGKKGKKKGQANTALLGFGSGTNYAVLEVPE